MIYIGVVNNKWVLNYEEDIKILFGVGKYGFFCFLYDLSLCDFFLVRGEESVFFVFGNWCNVKKKRMV